MTISSSARRAREPPNRGEAATGHPSVVIVRASGSPQGQGRQLDRSGRITTSAPQRPPDEDGSCWTVSVHTRGPRARSMPSSDREARTPHPTMFIRWGVESLCVAFVVTQSKPGKHILFTALRPYLLRSSRLSHLLALADLPD
jgi:hypothetical protein